MCYETGPRCRRQEHGRLQYCCCQVAVLLLYIGYICRVLFVVSCDQSYVVAVPLGPAHVCWWGSDSFRKCLIRVFCTTFKSHLERQWWILTSAVNSSSDPLRCPMRAPGVVRIDPLRFLDGCPTRRLNQV